MLSETLNLWSNGAVTLPKAWRDRWPTKHFMAEETKEGYLIIKPIIMQDVLYYEDEGGFGLRFPHGMEMREFADRMEEANKSIECKEKNKKRSRKKSS